MAEVDTATARGSLGEYLRTPIPPEPGADATPLYRVAASYWFTKRAAVNAEVAHAGYRTEGVKYYYVTTKLRVIGRWRKVASVVGGVFIIGSTC